MKIRARLLLSIGTVVLASAAPALAEPPPAFNPTATAPPAYGGNPGPKIGGNNGKKEQHEKEKLEKEKEKLQKEKLHDEKEKEKEKGKYEKLSEKKPGWKDPKGPPDGFDRKKAEERRRHEREELQKKLAQKKPSPEMSAELKLHAQRIAELDRIGDLAKAKGDTASNLRVQLLVTKENARHEKAMKKLGGWK